MFGMSKTRTWPGWRRQICFTLKPAADLNNTYRLKSPIRAGDSAIGVARFARQTVDIASGLWRWIRWFIDARGALP